MEYGLLQVGQLQPKEIHRDIATAEIDDFCRTVKHVSDDGSDLRAQTRNREAAVNLQAHCHDASIPILAFQEG